MEMKTAFIAGGTGGIGKEVARQLARNGYHVIIADRNKAIGNNLKNELKSNLTLSLIYFQS